MQEKALFAGFAQDGAEKMSKRRKIESLISFQFTSLHTDEDISIQFPSTGGVISKCSQLTLCKVLLIKLYSEMLTLLCYWTSQRI